LSGNLNFRLPLLHLRSRALKATVSCSYNSQLFKRKNSSTRSYGSDLGVGYGWRVQVGCMIPEVRAGKVAGYTYADGTGAEYHLTQSGDKWVCVDGTYITWDPESSTLYLKDGSILVFGCTAGAKEPDAGNQHPTVIRDTNGNQIVLRYLPGLGESQTDSSGRISEISDARAVTGSDGQRSYVFIYDADHMPHLSSIVSNVGKESYSFSYSNQGVISPFAAEGEIPSFVRTLQAVQGASGHDHVFSYNSHGELTQGQLGHGGVLNWDYTTYSFATGMSVREVAKRRMSDAANSADVQEHSFERDPSDGFGAVHGSAIIHEPNGTSSRVWKFNTDSSSPFCGLVDAAGDNSQGKLVRSRTNTWTQTDAGIPYISCHSKTLDPGTPSEVTASEYHVRDQFGNLLSARRFDYGNSEKPSRSVDHTYLADQAYLDKHILNRRVSTTMTSGQQSTKILDRTYDSTPLIDRQGLPHHDKETFGTDNNVRGNVTEMVKGGVYKRVHRDIAGLVHGVHDSAGSQMSVMVPGVPNPAAANGNSLALQVKYSGGRPTQVTAPSGAQRTATYDDLGRPATITSTNGGTTEIQHQVSPTSITTSRNGRWKKTTRDGFGRVVKIEHGDASGTVSQQVRQFGPAPHSTIGKLSRVSSWHKLGADPAWTSYRYDDLGRLSSIDFPFAGGKKGFTYAGNTTTVTDPLGNWKQVVHNASHKLTKVVMPNPNGGSNLETHYSYDALGNLASVKMPRSGGTQTRKFQYDSGGRIVSRQHAESGKQNFIYNSDGTLASKTDAKGQSEVYTRDSFKRVTSVQRYDKAGKLQAHESPTFVYDANPYAPDFSQNTHGRLAAAQWGDKNTGLGLITEMYSYTVTGRLAAKRIRINRGSNDLNFDMGYSYDKDGRLVSLDYPSGGPSLQYSYDATGKLVGIESASNSIVKDVAYNDQGSLAAMKIQALGDGQYLAESRTYDANNRLVRLVAGPENPGAGQDKIPSLDLAYSYRKGDGRLKKETDNLKGVNVTYDYDIQGRISSAKSSDSSWGLAYEYDDFGNLTRQGVTHGSAFAHEVIFDPATNWMLGHGTDYDANGNIVHLPGLELHYDVQNRLKTTVSTDYGQELYGYDAKNLRIWKRLPNGKEEFSVFNDQRQKIATYRIETDETGSLSAKLTVTNIYLGKRLVRSHGEAVVVDRLQSVRAWAGEDGGRTTKYLPFGEELHATAQGRPKFDGYERDHGSGLDYAVQRYYASASGRFMTPDPYEKSAHPGTPSTWNRYSFVSNDPINRIDPNGLNDGDPAGQDIMYTADGHISSIETDYSNGTKVVQYYNLDGTVAQTITYFENGTSTDQNLAALPMAPFNPFDEFAVEDIAAIGKLTDPAMEQLANDGLNVFQTTDWTAQANIDWVNSVINEGESVVIGSDLTEANLLADETLAGGTSGLFDEGFSIFGDELGLFLEAGYELFTVEEAGEILLILLLL
jgi:RHS repeat-associated protein